MVAETTESYVPDWTVLEEGRMEVTETNPFDVWNRVTPAKRWLTRLFIINSRFLTMANDKTRNILSLKACLL
jgi:hypothetical protein